MNPNKPVNRRKDLTVKAMLENDPSLKLNRLNFRFSDDNPKFDYEEAIKKSEGSFDIMKDLFNTHHGFNSEPNIKEGIFGETESLPGFMGEEKTQKDPFMTELESPFTDRFKLQDGFKY